MVTKININQVKLWPLFLILETILWIFPLFSYCSGLSILRLVCLLLRLQIYLLSMIYLLIKYLSKLIANMKVEEYLLILCNHSQRLVKEINKNHLLLLIIWTMMIKVLNKELLQVTQLISFIYIMLLELHLLANLLDHMKEICKEEQNMHKNISLILKMPQLVLYLQLLLLILNLALNLLG